MQITDREEIAKMIKSDKSLAERWIENTVKEVESNTKFRIPEANKKNGYLRACWLLYIFQKAELITGEHDKVKDNIYYLKIAMETLRGTNGNT